VTNVSTWAVLWLLNVKSHKKLLSLALKKNVLLFSYMLTTNKYFNLGGIEP
jgi:hypothetical protein